MSGGATVRREPWGALPDGRTAEIVTLANGRGTEARIATLGGTLLSLRVADRERVRDDVALGFDTVDAYLAPDNPWMGGLIGRYANRIARGRFAMDGREVRLPINHGGHHLHGGPEGFHRRLWTAEAFVRGGEAGVWLSYTSADGEEGWPGTLSVRVLCVLTAADQLGFEYHAETDAPTHVNLTQHGYWNLAGLRATDVLGHDLTVRAARYLPVDATALPTGEIAAVEGTPFDLRAPARLGERVSATGGFDHTFVLDGGDDTPSARLHDPVSGRVLDIFTTEPGMQVYTANAFDGGLMGSGGRRFAQHAAVALETQHFPDSPNRPAFPSTLLRPGDRYTSRTVYAFRTDAD